LRAGKGMDRLGVKEGLDSKVFNKNLKKWDKVEESGYFFLF
jgi:hypothetical protein